MNVCRVLLIDDAPECEGQIRDVLKNKLLNDWELKSCFGLRSGIPAISEWHADVLLLDLSLLATKGEPASSADETVKNVIPAYAHILPICILTGHEDEAGYLDPCINAGAMDYFVKQFYFSQGEAMRLCFLHDLRIARLNHKRIYPK
jgi:DNA-binding NarL/FixJ family response regulator